MAHQGVSIIKASRLKKADTFGQSDPFFICRIGSLGSSWNTKGVETDGLEFRSKTIKNCNEPEWGAKFTFEPSEDTFAMKVFSAFANKTLPNMVLELTIRIYDKDRGRMDDFLGEASIRLPEDGIQGPTSLPLTGEDGVQGYITVEFYLNDVTELYECTRRKDHLVDVKLSFEEISKGVRHFFERADEGGKKPSLRYWKSLPGVKAAFESGDPSYFWSRSEDGGLTCPFLEPGTKAILSHDRVVDEFRSFGQRWASGEICRGNDLAFVRMNNNLWHDMDPPYMSLNLTVKQHALVRPLLEEAFNLPDKTEIIEHASEYLNSFIDEHRPLRITDDVGVWICIYLHKVLLGMELEYTQGLRYHEVKKDISLITALPDKLLDVPLLCKKVQEAIDFRKEMMELFKPFLLHQYPQLEGSDEQLKLVASTWMDAILFNIDSATRVIVRALEHLQEEQNNLGEDGLLALVWEVIRYYGPVPTFQYCSGPDERQRTCLMISTAMRDPRVWGEDADEFKLRDLGQYKSLSTGFAEPAVDEEAPTNNRYCPGKELCLTMATGFLRVFLNKRDDFTLSGSGPFSERELIPKVESLEEIMERLRKGDQDVEFTADQMRAYFRNLKCHPKFDDLDSNTKFFWFVVKTTIGLQKTGEGAVGRKAIGEVCLPKPKSKLSFKMVDGVPGLGIVDSDEDWTDLNIFEDLVLKSRFASTAQSVGIFLIKSLCDNDEPTFFASDEEAQELVKKHFPGDFLPSPNEDFSDIASEEALSDLAFYGIGQVYLERKPDEDTYQVDLTSLGSLQPKPGYECPGARAVFKADGSILEIFVSSSGTFVKPGDDEWDHAKWVWKTSVLFQTTLDAHLGVVHFTIANCAHIAARTTLNADHAIRRVLKVFLFNTGQVNLGGYFFLAEKGMILDHISGVTWESVTQAFSYSMEKFRFATFPEYLDSKNIGEDVKERIPLYTDALPIWHAFHRFFTSYVNFFYADSEDIFADKELNSFWECVDLRGNLGSPWKYGLPDLNRESLIDYLTHMAFNVTAWHEHVGTIVHYVLPSQGAHMGMGLKIRPGKEEADVQAVVQNLGLVAFTGMDNPPIMSNWKHLLPSLPEIHNLHDALMEDLQRVSEEVDTLNASAPCIRRPRICQTFNPKYIETSVSL